MPTYTIKKGSGIEPGVHTGIIKSFEEVERGKDKWKYIEMNISVDQTDKEVKLSVPSPKEGIINPKSELGKLLAQFVNLEEDAQIDPEVILLGKEIKYQTTDDDKGYSNILKETIKKK